MFSTEWHNTGMFDDYYRLSGTEADARHWLAAPDLQDRRLFFFVVTVPDVNARDRLLLYLLRPHFSEALHYLARRRSTLNMTNRQFQMLPLLALGHTNA